MKAIIMLFFTLFIASQAHASEALIHGGFIPDTTQWEDGYFVTISHIDGNAIKGAYLKTKIQELQIPQGAHTIKMSCAFAAKPKTMLVGEKEITVIFSGGSAYKLTAIINYGKEIENKLYKYCEPNIEEIKS